MTTRVAIVEDHALTRLALRTSLANQFDIVGEASDGIAGWELVKGHHPDVAVVDIGLPGMDGIALTHRIRHELPETRVVIVTMMDSEQEVLASLAAGADAYVLKNADPARIADVVRIAAEGGAYFDPQIAHLVLARVADGEQPARASSSPLSPRETEVLRLVADGVSNVDIAQRLHIGLGTVKGHVRDILEKLAASDRTQAAVVALRKGFI